MKEILLVLLLILLVVMALLLSPSKIDIKVGGKQEDRLNIIDKLSREFSRYCLIRDIFEELSGDFRGKDKYEIGAILERFMIALAQGAHDTDPVIKEVYMGDPLIRKMQKELANKHIKLPWGTLKGMTERINSWLKDPPCPRVVYNIKDNIFKCTASDCRHEFTYKLPRDRYDALVGVAGGKENVDLHILVMLLRYESLFPQGQQWSSPGDFNDRLFALGVDLEAFSSPKNSGLLMAWWRAGAGKPPKFCSLFPDTDSYFGSIGNFYSDKVQSALGNFKGVVVNPPFVESIMNSALEKIQEAVKAGVRTVFVVVLPSWEDSDAYKVALANSRVVVQLAPKSYYFVSHGDPPKKIVASFRSTIFVIGGALAEDDLSRWRGAIIEGFRMR